MRLAYLQRPTGLHLLRVTLQVLCEGVVKPAVLAQTLRWWKQRCWHGLPRSIQNNDVPRFGFPTVKQDYCAVIQPQSLAWHSGMQSHNPMRVPKQSLLEKLYHCSTASTIFSLPCFFNTPIEMPYMYLENFVMKSGLLPGRLRSDEFELM